MKPVGGGEPKLIECAVDPPWEVGAPWEECELAVGFTLSGSAPVVVERVARGGLAGNSGIRIGDQLESVDDVDVSAASLAFVRTLIQVIHSSWPRHSAVVTCRELACDSCSFTVFNVGFDAGNLRAV